MDKKLEFSTSDLALAAALSLFHPIKSIDKKNPKRVLFIFDRDDDLDELLEMYYAGQFALEVKVYYNSIRILKNRIYGNE